MLLIQMEQHFGVAPRGKEVAAGFQLGPQLAEIVNLAIEDDPYRAVLIGHRLSTRNQIDDTEPAMCKSYSASCAFERHRIIGIQQRSPANPVQVDALAIRASVSERRAHPV